jgi:hypothetical protein
MNLSPLPSSTRKHDAAWLSRADGIPVPHEMIRISSGANGSVLGKYTSRSELPCVARASCATASPSGALRPITYPIPMAMTNTAAKPRMAGRDIGRTSC